VIRRGFWLVTGAVLGVTGYRKAAHLVHTLTGQQAGNRTGQIAKVSPARLPRARLQPELAASQLPASGGPETSWPAKLVGGAQVAATFVRDVREGMADYHDQHDRQLGRSLGSQRDRIESGASAWGHREP
jgi:hypothetical protein